MEIEIASLSDDNPFVFSMDNFVAMSQAAQGDYRIEPLLYGRARIVKDEGNLHDWQGW